MTAACRQHAACEAIRMLLLQRCRSPYVLLAGTGTCGVSREWAARRFLPSVRRFCPCCIATTSPVVCMKTQQGLSEGWMEVGSHKIIVVTRFVQCQASVIQHCFLLLCDLCRPHTNCDIFHPQHIARSHVDMGRPSGKLPDQVSRQQCAPTLCVCYSLIGCPIGDWHIPSATKHGTDLL